MAIGFMTSFPLSLVMMLSMKDIDAVLNSQLPYAEIFYQITGSKAVTTLVLCWASLVMFCELSDLAIIYGMELSNLTIFYSRSNRTMGDMWAISMGFGQRCKFTLLGHFKPPMSRLTRSAARNSLFGILCPHQRTA